MRKKEIGGFIEIDNHSNNGTLFHTSAIKLNTARNALEYLIRAKNINELYLPKYLCNVVFDVCIKNNVKMVFYKINGFEKNLDLYKNIAPRDSFFYFVNYYGFYDNNFIKKLKNFYPNLIVDNVQAYFQKPVKGVDTIYTCRKFFGVPDGAFLYTDAIIKEKLPISDSTERFKHLYGRRDYSANDFYHEFLNNERYLCGAQLEYMSPATENELNKIDQFQIKKIREQNYKFLRKKLDKYNEISVPKKINGPFCYPFKFKKATQLRKALLDDKIYVPVYWPNVLEEKSIESEFAQNILPLPCDQRYCDEDMDYIAKKILYFISND